MKNRLERGRKLLRQRLERRGIAAPTTLLLVGLSSRSAPAAVRVAACRLYETASPSVVALAGEAVAGSMIIKTIILMVALGLTAACIKIGGRLSADQPPASKTPPAAFIAQAKQSAKEESAKDSRPRLDRFGDPLPEEALARFGTLRFRQGYSVISICFTPDGKAIAIAGNGSKGRSLGLWDVATGKELFQFDDGKSKIPFGCFTFSPDGKMLAVRRNDNVELLGARTGEFIRTLKGHAGWIGAIVFSPDGKTLVSGGSDRTIRFWNVATGQEIAKIERHTESVAALALSSNGKLLASAGSDKIVRVWDMQTRGLLHEFQQEPSVFVPSLSFSPDGNQLASAGYDEPCIVWDLIKGELAYKLDTDDKPGIKAVFAPNGKWLAAGCGDTVRLYEPSTGKEIRRWQAPGSYIAAMDVTSDSKTIATSTSWHCGVRLWDVETGKETPSFDSLRSMIGQLQLSPDGKSLFGVGLIDRRAIRWNTQTAEPVETVPMPADALPGANACLSPGGAFFAWTALKDRQTDDKVHPHLKVIDMESGKVAREIGLGPDGARAVTFSPDGRALALENSQRDSDFKLIEFATGETIATFHGHHSGVWAIQFSPDGRTLYTGGGDSTIMKWDATARHSKGSSTPSAAAAWEALAQDASKAYPAGWDLVDAPKEAVALLRQKIQPPKKLDLQDVQPTVDLLNADKVAQREKAAKDLQALGFSGEPILRKLLETEKRPEVKQRLQTILDQLDGQFVRIHRGLQALETIGNTDTKQLLRELAAGAPNSMLTKEAAAALKRMAK